LKKLSEAELTRLSLGMTIPDEFLRKPTTIELPPRNPDPNRKQFSILDFVQQPRRKASGNYYTQCLPVRRRAMTGRATTSPSRSAILASTNAGQAVRKK